MVALSVAEFAVAAVVVVVVVVQLVDVIWMAVLPVAVAPERAVVGGNYHLHLV